MSYISQVFKGAPDDGIVKKQDGSIVWQGVLDSDSNVVVKSSDYLIL
jgi:hypothetical protein